MEKIYILIVFLGFYLTNYAQVPSEINGINYQGIARDDQGEILANEVVEISFDFQDNSNVSLFTDSHTKTTNPFGLFTLVIGNGSGNNTAVIGNVWESATKIVINASVGGITINFDEVNLSAVPYAFKAKYEGQNINYNSTSGYLRITDGSIDANGNTTFLPDSTLISTGGSGTVLPPGGTSGFVLSTDGNGNYTWVQQTTGGGGDDWGNQVIITGSNFTGDGTPGDPLEYSNLDNDSDNEIQDLTLNTSTNILTITNNLTATDIDLSDYLELPQTGVTGQVLTWNGFNWVGQNSGTGADNWGNDVVNTNGTNISGDGTITNPLTFTEVDGSITNEIQDLSLNTTTNILTITNNGTPTNIDLTPYLDNTDAQTLALAGSSLSISGGNNITLPSGSDNQDLSLNTTNNELSLTNDLTKVDLSPYLDNTDEQKLENFSFNNTNNILSLDIENGNSVTVNLTDLAGKDADWYEVNSAPLSAPDDINDNIYTNGNVGIGIDPTLGKLQISDALSSNNSAIRVSKTLNGNNLSVIEIYPSGNIAGNSNWGAKVDAILTSSNGFYRGFESQINMTGASQSFASYNVSRGTNTATITGVFANAIGVGTSNGSITGLAAKAEGASSNKTGISSNTSGAGGTQIGVESIVENTSATTTNYGFKFKNNGLVGNTYGIHTDDEDKNYFSNKVGIGTEPTSTAVVMLDVEGKIRMKPETSLVTSSTQAGAIPVSDANGIMTWTVPSSLGIGGSDNDWHGITGGTGTGTSPANLTDDLYTNGKVGIFGTNGGTNISNLLTIGQTVSTTSPMAIIRNGNLNGDASIQFSGGTSYYSIGSDASNNCFSITQGTGGLNDSDNRLVILNSSGFTGIGTNTPTVKLDVNGQIRMRTGANDKYVAVSDANGVMSWKNPVTEGYTPDLDWVKVSNGQTPDNLNDNIYTLGNVGIGTSSPSGKTDIENVTESISLRVRNNKTSGTAYGIQTRLSNVGNTNNSLIYGTWTGINNQNNTDKTYSHYSFINNSGSGLNYGYYFSGINSSGNTYGIYMEGEDKNYISGDLGIGNPNPSYKLQLSTNSAAKPSSSSWIVASDKRLKENIKPYNSGLLDLMKIKPVWYTYNGKGGMPKETAVGIIAQDLKEIAPYMVNEWTYENEKNKSKENYLGVDNGAMTYMLINATKEQQELILIQEEKLNKQQEQINLLIKEIENLKK